MKRVDYALIRSIFRKRKVNATKWDQGHVLLICGSRGKFGSAVLSSRACLRSGVGLLTVHIPSFGETIIQVSIPEAMVDADEHQNFSTKIMDQEKFDVIAVGPGIGRDECTASMLEELLLNSKRPMVIDADALNILSSHPEWIMKIPAGSILTPHERELKRLIGDWTSDEVRNEKLLAFSQLLRCTILCKGQATKIALPDGTLYENTTGNPGMAKAGVGDVLTGVIAALLSQGYTPEESTLLGVYIHGESGDISIRNKSIHSLLASDLIEGLSVVFKNIEKDCN